MYLATASSPEAVRLMEAGTIGLMGTPYSRPAAVARSRTWAADNGAFRRAPAPADLLRYLVDMAPWRESCLFAVAPDRWGDAALTLHLAAPVLPAIRELGYRAALAAQDGLADQVIPWDTFDALMVGG